MPLFFFDTNDGSTAVQDDVGCKAANPQAARTLALEAIAGIFNDPPPSLDQCTYTIDVRDEAGRRIYRAKVEVVGEWVS